MKLLTAAMDSECLHNDITDGDRRAANTDVAVVARTNAAANAA
jgi:hypothetical protein